MTTQRTPHRTAALDALAAAELFQGELRKLHEGPTGPEHNRRKAEAQNAIGHALKKADVEAHLDVAQAIRDGVRSLLHGQEFGSLIRGGRS